MLRNGVWLFSKFIKDIQSAKYLAVVQQLESTLDGLLSLEFLPSLAPKINLVQKVGDSMQSDLTPN